VQPPRVARHTDRYVWHAAPASEVAVVPQVSAGILLYRRTGNGTEIFLVHPGGPYWARKDEGAWSVPKGLVDAGEDELACARREFNEETGFDPPPAGSERQLPAAERQAPPRMGCRGQLRSRRTAQQPL
jgi:8-oxo-dGTP pyrophosphatase MutT (NUDIX family)